MGRHRDRAVACALALVAALGAADAASARTAQWAADWAGNSGHFYMESGELADVFLVAKNVGSATWERGKVNLGTVGPTDNPLSGRDRPSPLSVDSGPYHWIGSNRPATLTEQSVASGQNGRFDFKIEAPPVERETEFRDYYSPVADGVAGGDWMYGCPTWCGVHLFVTVRPAQPPVVQFTSTPNAVARGAKIDVAANAADNVALDRVVFSLAGESVTDTTAPFTAQFDSSRLEPGSNLVTAHSYDRLGQSGSDVRTFNVKVGSTGGGGTPPVVQDPTVSINGGAPYTNNPIVSLTFGVPADTTAIELSNDGGFGDSLTLPIVGRNDWTLLTSGFERDAKVVYARYRQPDGRSVVATDDIVLDQTAPALSKTVATRTRDKKKPACQVTAYAKDGTSGIGAVQVKKDGRLLDPVSVVRQPSEGTQKLKTTVKGTPKSLSTRVFDGAGNPSSWSKVTLRSCAPPKKTKKKGKK